jgi:hypothetical protein
MHQIDILLFDIQNPVEVVEVQTLKAKVKKSITFPFSLYYNPITHDSYTTTFAFKRNPVTVFQKYFLGIDFHLLFLAVLGFEFGPSSLLGRCSFTSL